MTAPRTSLGLITILLVFLTSAAAIAVDIDVEATTSGGSTSNLFSDSTEQNDTYSTSSVDLNWYPTSFARVNLVSEYSYYGNFFNLSNLVYGGGVTFIPIPDSSRFSAYLEGNLKKREYRESGDSAALNANEFTGDDYDAKLGVGYRLSPRTQVRAGMAFASTQYNLDGVIDKEKMDLTAGANTTLFGSFALDLEIGYSTGKYQQVDPMKYYPFLDTLMPRLAITPGEQYSILLTDRLKSFYISPRLSRSLGRKTGLTLTYLHREFIDKDDSAVIYGYSTGYLSPWLNDFAGDGVVLKVKTFLIPRLITTLAVGVWDREHLRTVERELRPDRLGVLTPTVNMLYARERIDSRRRVDFKVQWPIRAGHGVTVEPSIQADYTDNNSSVLVYEYEDFALNGGVTVRF